MLPKLSRSLKGIWFESEVLLLPKKPQQNTLHIYTFHWKYFNFRFSRKQKNPTNLPPFTPNHVMLYCQKTLKYIFLIQLFFEESEVCRDKNQLFLHLEVGLIKVITTFLKILLSLKNDGTTIIFSLLFNMTQIWMD